MERACCKERFEDKSGRLRRTGICTQFKGGPSAAQTLSDVFDVTVTPEKELFVCVQCSLTIRSLDTKKKTIVSTSVKSSQLRQALIIISKSKYHTGFRRLFNSSKAAKKAAVRVICEVVRKEAINFAKTFGNKNNSAIEDITNFSWEIVLKDAWHLCPTLIKIIIAALTKKENWKTITRRRGKTIISAKPLVGSLLCIVGFIRSYQCNILQRMVSLLLWLGGCKTKVM
ncbi:uncharacterized protein LOC121371367 [Gigantopelta aegis]|uniref:uncharacterized protein LOC121371367 n=1 Tax=Gigantopelta aegis TaxID=1735272 RepID=UPI001B88973D|nr:uncharacterized protein LOC121371367 [Gigantopelta aegis]